MVEQQQSYRQLFKSTTLFGGVQVFNIIFHVIRTKFIAIILGPSGMGIVGLLTATTGFIGSFTNMGLGTSAVKNIAAADAQNEGKSVEIVVNVLRRLMWATGLLGMVVTAALAPWLSRLTFGNNDYTFAFIWISVTLLLQQLCNGQLVILQGLRKLKDLAKANVLGSLFALLVSVPLYYKWEFNGIVPVIILSSLTSMIVSFYFSRKLSIRSVGINIKEITSEGKDMVKFGFLLSLSGLIALGASYILRIYISKTGGVEQVGLYNAGFAIINTYVGMIFSAMSTDYYPRLAAVANDNVKSNELINQQAEVAILVITPILTVFFVFISWVVILLYSSKFLAINEMIQWAALGMYFKAVSWSIGYVLIAKGASKLFFWNELIANIYILGLNIAGFKIAGLEGLGISFLIAYFMFLIQVYLITHTKYGFTLSKTFIKIAVIQLIFGVLCFTTMRLFVPPLAYIIGAPIILLSAYISFRELEKRIGLRSLLHENASRFIKRR